MLIPHSPAQIHALSAAMAPTTGINQYKEAIAMAAHGNNLDPEARYTPTNLSHPDRVAMMRQRDEIHRLPETDFEPPLPVGELFDQSSERDHRHAAAYARDLKAIRDLPERTR